MLQAEAGNWQPPFAIAVQSRCCMWCVRPASTYKVLIVHHDVLLALATS